MVCDMCGGELLYVKFVCVCVKLWYVTCVEVKLLYVKFVCVKLWYVTRAGGGGGGGGARDTESKTRTPHKVVGKY